MILSLKIPTEQGWYLVTRHLASQGFELGQKFHNNIIDNALKQVKKCKAPTLFAKLFLLLFYGLSVFNANSFTGHTDIPSHPHVPLAELIAELMRMPQTPGSHKTVFCVKSVTVSSDSLTRAFFTYYTQMCTYTVMLLMVNHKN